MVKSQEMSEAWKKLIVGQDHAIDKIVPYIVRAMAGLNAPGHPVGVFFLMGPTGTGKALPMDELVATPTGFVQNGTLVAGSMVIGRDGTPTRVEAVYPQGLVDIYQITFADGRTIECCGDHLWEVYNKHWEPKPSSKIFSTLDVKKFVEKGRELHVPLCAPVEYPEITLPIDPYLLGALIGDGHLSKSFSFTNIDSQIITTVNRTMSAAANGSHLIQYDDSSYGITMLNNPRRNQFTTTEDNSLRGHLRQMGLYKKRSWEKFIPSQYQTSSVEQRFALIQGLMDTDGTTGKNGTISFCTTSDQLAKDFQMLVWSVGGYAKITPKTTRYTYKGQKKVGRPAFTVNIRHTTPERFFSLTRKLELAKRNVQYRNRLRLKIKTVEFVGKKEAQCITVSNNDALYVARNYIVTHNTRTAETLAEVLHGTDKNVLRVDCGEFQMEHEVAKLIGAPPGYLGHRETHPVLSQAKINAVATEKSPFSIVLFDEIEKAAASLWRVLLGILDKATLRLGDNTSADFQKTIIFMSSNLGAKEMSEIFSGGFGFNKLNTSITADMFSEANFAAIQKIGMGALSRKFPPEFPNRVDEVVTYKPLNTENLRKITLIELAKVQAQITERLGVRSFNMNYDEDALSLITAKGTSIQYGARELKRVVNRYIMNPLADDFIDGKIPPGSDVFCKMGPDEEGVNKIIWEIESGGPFEEGEEEPAAAAPDAPVVKRTRRKPATT